MDKLKAILENINAKNFNKALDDCNEYIKKNTLNKNYLPIDPNLVPRNYNR